MRSLLLQNLRLISLAALATRLMLALALVLVADTWRRMAARSRQRRP